MYELFYRNYKLVKRGSVETLIFNLSDECKIELVVGHKTPPVNADSSINWKKVKRAKIISIEGEQNG
jgi:hypothetical protein